jgi:dienelactone hydrolase
MLAAVLAVAGCGGGSKAGAGPSPTDDGRRAGAKCESLAAAGKQARFKATDGTQLAGVELGAGKTGVVLAHQNMSDLCEWLPYGKLLADRGYRVLAFDFAGDGASSTHLGGAGLLADDVLAATAHLRGLGVTDIVLMGASKGGAASLAAAVALQPPPAAVVSLSAPATFSGADAASAVPKLKTPVLYLATENDHPFAETAKELYDATPATTERAIFVGIGSEHGTGLLASPEATKIKAEIDKLLAAHAPPKA